MASDAVFLVRKVLLANALQAVRHVTPHLTGASRGLSEQTDVVALEAIADHQALSGEPQLHIVISILLHRTEFACRR